MWEFSVDDKINLDSAEKKGSSTTQAGKPFNYPTTWLMKRLIDTVVQW